MKKVMYLVVLVAVLFTGLSGCTFEVGEVQIKIGSSYKPTLYPLPTLSTDDYSKRQMEMSAYGMVLTMSGFYEDAIDLYEKMGDKNVSADLWNNLCWDGSLHNAAARVMPACEKAVSMDPELGAFRDSRGLARGLTNDIKGAIEDFGFFNVWFETLSESEKKFHGYSDEMVKKRREWISALNNGQNPFTKEMMDMLVKDESGNNDRLMPILIYLAPPILVEYRHYDTVNEWVEKIEKENPGKDVIPFYYYYVCVLGSVKGDAEKVMSFCNLAVEKVSEAGFYKDGRGFARAINGDVKGAISDFEEFIKFSSSKSDEDLNNKYHNFMLDKQDIQTWLEMLKKEKFPFSQDDFTKVNNMHFFMVQ